MGFIDFTGSGGILAGGGLWKIERTCGFNGGDYRRTVFYACGFATGYGNFLHHMGGTLDEYPISCRF
jgi:hypothetical protein